MSTFPLRRAIERLRDGLFDPIAISRLTMEEEQVQKYFVKGLKALDKGESDHLCICGSYGQGKSHTLTHLRSQALSQGYATSLVQLDIRETPFHQFDRAVYRAVVENLSLPEGKSFIDTWKQWDNPEVFNFLPIMPHRFRMILTAMLQRETCDLEQAREPYIQPEEASIWLEKAFFGHDLSLAYLKSILHNREVEGYQKYPLTLRGNLPYVEMVQVLGNLLKEMGYKGLILFFDEAESITQGRLKQRAKSYEILDHFFHTKSYVYPIFALTDDFFEVVKNEPYESTYQGYQDKAQDQEQEHDQRERSRAEETEEKAKASPFAEHYAERWKHIKVANLQAFHSKGWDTLQSRLIELYGEAYQIPISIAPQSVEIKKTLQKLLNTLKTQDTRLKLKALVHQLDLETQHYFLKQG